MPTVKKSFLVNAGRVYRIPQMSLQKDKYYGRWRRVGIGSGVRVWRWVGVGCGMRVGRISGGMGGRLGSGG